MSVADLQILIRNGAYNVTVNGLPNHNQTTIKILWEYQLVKNNVGTLNRTSRATKASADHLCLRRGINNLPTQTHEPFLYLKSKQ